MCHSNNAAGEALGHPSHPAPVCAEVQSEAHCHLVIIKWLSGIRGSRCLSILTVMLPCTARLSISRWPWWLTKLLMFADASLLMLLLVYCLFIPLPAPYHPLNESELCYIQTVKRIENYKMAHPPRPIPSSPVPSPTNVQHCA